MTAWMRGKFDDRQLSAFNTSPNAVEAGNTERKEDGNWGDLFPKIHFGHFAWICANLSSIPFWS